MLLRVLSCCLVLSVLRGPVAADDPGVNSDPGDDTAALSEPDPSELDDLLSFKGLIYRQKDTGGNPRVDEDASVVEGILFVRKTITERDTVHVRLLGDVISAASQRQVERNADMMISGATTFHPFRYDVGGGVTHDFGRWDLGVSASFAQEYAYRSHGLGVKSTVRLFEDSTKITVRGQGYSDTVRTIRFDGSEQSRDDRDTLTGEIGLVQTLTPRAHANFVYHYTRQSGFLETSFNSVFIGNTQVTEELPRSRRRQSWTARLKHAVMDRDAVEVGYRYYRDDWGIRAHTAEVRYFHRIHGTPLLLEPSYRLYVQSEADYFGDDFAPTARHRTSDSDLGDFLGHAFGLRVVFLDVAPFGFRGDYDLGANYYHRDDGLDLYWATFGFAMPF